MIGFRIAGDDATAARPFQSGEFGFDLKHSANNTSSMPLQEGAVTLTPEQVRELASGLSHMRHEINNHLSLIMASAELLRLKPDMVEKLVKSIVDQPTKISKEMAAYSQILERIVGQVR